MTLQDIGRQIRERRMAAGLTQDSLGESVGKNGRSISGYESGTQDMNLSTLIGISDALGTDVISLLRGTVQKKKSVEIRVYQLDDRMNVAQILVKNGYTVSQVKRSKEGQKTVEYRLKLEECEDNLRVIRKGD